jgi:sterol 3beta-glucosyltransferase
MKIAIAVVGSRGDAQPLIEIACRLLDAGHEVLFGTTPDVAPFVARFGIPVRGYTSLDLGEFLASERGQRSFFNATTIRQLRTINELSSEHSEEIDSALIDICDGADVVITVRTVEERLAVVLHDTDAHLFTLHYYPLHFSARVPSPLLGAWTQRLPVPASALTHLFLSLAWDVSILTDQWALARRVGYRRWWELPSSTLRRSRHTVVEAFGTAVVGTNLVPTRHHRRIGFIRMDPARDPRRAGLDPELTAWLGGLERKPVYIGFGSMPVPDLAGTVVALDQRLRARDRQAVFAAGWSDLTGVDPASLTNIRLVEEVDHLALFPHCAAAVHHGGAGTVATSIATGTPTVVCAQGFDQYFWGLQLQRRGAGIALRRKDFGADAIVDALDRVLTDGTREAARRLQRSAEPDMHGADQLIELINAGT